MMIRGLFPLLPFLAATAQANSCAETAPFDCPEGTYCTKWSDGCNECGCGEDGTADVSFCTAMMCPCLEDNSCIGTCHDNDACVPKSNNGDNKVEDTPADATASACAESAPFDCPEGTYCNQWNDGCNDCQCSEDGPDVAMCTLKMCPCLEDNSCVPTCQDNTECVPKAAEEEQACPQGEGMCTMEYNPVMCGTSRCEYSNPCGAELAGFNPETDCVSSLPTEEEPLPVTDNGDLDCPAEADCETCLEAGCVHTGGECMSSCMIADAACWDMQYHEDKTVAQVCAIKSEREADQEICGAQEIQEDCGLCTSTLKSDGVSMCEYYYMDGGSEGYCGAGDCGMDGLCGTDTCRDAPEDDTISGNAVCLENAPFECPEGTYCKNWNDGCNECACSEDPNGPEIARCTRETCPCYEDNSCVPTCKDNADCVPKVEEGATPFSATTPPASSNGSADSVDAGDILTSGSNVVGLCLSAVLVGGMGYVL